jgi:inner membrane protein YidH
VTDQPPPSPKRPPGFDEEGDATRRTWLANERTMLAWLRTGLTATAVAIAVGKVVPDLDEHATRWPYSVLGAGYGLLGVALVLYGLRRRSEVDAAIRAGEYAPAGDQAVSLIAIFAVVLALGTALVVVFNS